MRKTNKLSVAQIARALDMSEQTVKNWVLWFEKTGGKTGNELPHPEYVQAGSRKFRFYKTHDLDKFIKFKENKLARWGLMSDFNAKRCWGAYGKDLLKRKKRGMKNVTRTKRNGK